MRRQGWIGVWLWASVAGASVLQTQSGTLGTMVADATNTADSVRADGAEVLTIFGTGTAGTNTGVACQWSPDGIVPFTTIAAGAAGGPFHHVGATTFSPAAPLICTIYEPIGVYRVANTTCNATCSITVKYFFTYKRY